MKLTSRLQSWARATFRRSRMENEMDVELKFHIQAYAEDLVRSGVPREEAMRRARLEFGGIERAKEECREAKGITFLEYLAQDVRYGVRRLVKTPVITTIALLSLALGIGANTAIYSLIDAVMLRMLPVQHPEQFMQIKFQSPVSPKPRISVTNPIWEQLRDHQDVFTGMLAWSPRTFDLAEGGEENDINGIYASGDYFSTLGVRPAAGRLLMASDDIRGCGGVAVLSYGFWQRHFAGAGSAIGSAIRLNGQSFPVVGVMQRGFTGTEAGAPLDVALPICAEALLDGKNAMIDIRAAWWLIMLGRLKPGVTIDQATAHLKVLSPEVFSDVVPQNWPVKDQDIFRKYTLMATPGSTGVNGFSGVREQYTRPLQVLMGVVGLVLLIACANVASVLLARSAARQKEMAVRLSLGASRGRLIRQVLTESLLLSVCGALLAAPFAQWGSAFLVRFVSTTQAQVFLDLKLNFSVLGFIIAIALACGLLMGVLPALRSTRISPMAAMKDEQLESASGRFHSGGAGWIVAAQIALSLILLVGSGLLVHTFTNLMTLDPGFDSSNVLLVQTNIHKAQVPEAARTALYGQMLQKLESTPGVASASQTWMMPLSGNEWSNDIKVPGRETPAGVDPNAYMNWVTPAFFSTMGTEVLAGRVFDARDSATSTPATVVDDFVARAFFPGENPVGKYLVAADKTREIIGVVRNAKYDSLDENARAIVYFPLAQMAAVGEGSTFEIRTAIDPSAVIPAVRDSLGTVMKSASLQFVTLKQKADDSVIQQRLLAALSGFFGTLALVLTAIGLYGVMAYVVSQRTREIGIRMALGAKRSSVLGLVMGKAAIILSVGIAAGLLGSIWVTRLIQQLLFGVKPSDPWAFSVAVGTLIAVAAVASYVPARRAMRVDPMVALRYE